MPPFSSHADTGGSTSSFDRDNSFLDGPFPPLGTKQNVVKPESANNNDVTTAKASDGDTTVDNSYTTCSGLKNPIRKLFDCEFGIDFDFDACNSFDSISVLCGAFPNNFPSRGAAAAKSRPCAECGRNCDRTEGYSYTMEPVEQQKNGTSDAPTSASPCHTNINSNTNTTTTSSETKKVYRHKWCTEIKTWRAEHARTYRAVLEELLAPRVVKDVHNRSPVRRRRRKRRTDRDRHSTTNPAQTPNAVEDAKTTKPGLVQRAKNFCTIKKEPTKKNSDGAMKKQSAESKPRGKKNKKKKKRGLLKWARRRRRIPSEPPKVITFKTKQKQSKASDKEWKRTSSIETESDTTPRSLEETGNDSQTPANHSSQKKDSAVNKSGSKLFKSKKSRETGKKAGAKNTTKEDRERAIAESTETKTIPQISKPAPAPHRGRPRCYVSKNPEEDLFII
eukprot:jgi/Psemu1/5266/gm1.5266_g